MSALTVTHSRRQFKFRWSRFFIYLVLIISVVFFLVPIYLLLITSFKSYQEVNMANMWNFPLKLSLESFKYAWFGSETGGYRGLSGNFVNSLILVIPASLTSAIVGSLNGYVFSKWKFKGSDAIFSLMLFGMFIPYQSILIPLVQVLQWISTFTNPIIHAIQGSTVISGSHTFMYWLGELIPGYGTIGGLIMVHVIYGLPIATLTFRNYYAGISRELIEAGMIDGDGFLGLYRHILFPISMPGFVVVLIWQFTSIWNDFLFGIIVTSDPNVQPITVALNNLAGSYIVEWNVQMAGALLSSLPTLLVYIFLSQYFIRGLMAGSLKG
ncbi:MAG TPA: ABC transporter permease [Anaerolineaceae bacterium]|jgi:glucose/mannose transport system permease protein|nr:ABC transporter permease [Anaerolineaceae bacterium]